MFFNNNVESILRKFHKTVEQLDRLSEKLTLKLGVIQAEIEDLEMQKEEFAVERARAVKISKKLDTLLS